MKTATTSGEVCVRAEHLDRDRDPELEVHAFEHNAEAALAKDAQHLKARSRNDVARLKHRAIWGGGFDVARGRRHVLPVDVPTVRVWRPHSAPIWLVHPGGLSPAAEV